jgi:hypothetical protein
MLGDENFKLIIIIIERKNNFIRKHIIASLKFNELFSMALKIV